VPSKIIFLIKNSATLTMELLVEKVDQRNTYDVHAVKSLEQPMILLQLQTKEPE